MLAIWCLDLVCLDMPLVLSSVTCSRRVTFQNTALVHHNTLKHRASHGLKRGAARNSAAQTTFARLTPKVWRSRALTTRLASLLYKTLVRPVHLYGLHARLMTRGDLESVERLQNVHIRRLLHTTPKKSECTACFKQVVYMNFAELNIQNDIWISPLRLVLSRAA